MYQQRSWFWLFCVRLNPSASGVFFWKRTAGNGVKIKSKKRNFVWHQRILRRQNIENKSDSKFFTWSMIMSYLLVMTLLGVSWGALGSNKRYQNIFRRRKFRQRRAKCASENPALITIVAFVSIVYPLRFEAVAAPPDQLKIQKQSMSFLFITTLISHTFYNKTCLTCPKRTNNEAIKPTWRIMLRTLIGEARKHDTRHTSRFQLCQTSVNIL